MPHLLLLRRCAGNPRRAIVFLVKNWVRKEQPLKGATSSQCCLGFINSLQATQCVSLAKVTFVPVLISGNATLCVFQRILKLVKRQVCLRPVATLKTSSVWRCYGVI